MMKWVTKRGRDRVEGNSKHEVHGGRVAGRQREDVRERQGADWSWLKLHLLSDW